MHSICNIYDTTAFSLYQINISCLHLKFFQDVGCKEIKISSCESEVEVHCEASLTHIRSGCVTSSYCSWRESCQGAWNRGYLKERVLQLCCISQQNFYAPQHRGYNSKHAWIPQANKFERVIFFRYTILQIRKTELYN